MATGDLKGLKENAEGGWDEVVLQATAEEMAAGSEASKMASPKNLKDSGFVRIHVGTTAPTDTTMLWLDTN